MSDLVNIGGKDYTLDEIRVLSKAGVLGVGQKNDPASTTLTAQTLNGPFPGNANQYGIFSSAGHRPQRFSALTRPDSMISAVINSGGLTRSRFTNELLDIVTGQTAGGSTNATGFCGNPPVVGNLKVMSRLFTWGSYYVKTNLDALPVIGQLRNRADVPGSIINAGPSNNPLIPDMMYRLTDSQSHLQTELYKIGVDLERTSEIVAMRGASGTDNSRTGWFAEFGGLDSQITTGITDSVSNVSVPAADSTIISYNADITGTNADGTGRNFYETLRDLYRGRVVKADRLGMAGTVFAFVMRREQFERVTDVVACQSAIYNCDGAQYEEVMRNGTDIQRARVEMLGGNYLLIDGMRVPVVFSDGIVFEGIANNTYRSDIYLVPFSWAGQPLLRMEYFPMNNQYAVEFANSFGRNNVTFLNDGMFIVGQRDTGLCVEYHFAARFRLILETPFLAGRIDNVEYSYTLDTVNAHPGESLYKNGGVTYRT